MTYNAGIPTSSELISTSQGQILTNFTQINTQFGGSSPSTGGDHDGFNTGSSNGSGAHNQVTFLANNAAPSLTRNSVSCVSGLYANTASALSCLFFQNATQNLQMTGPTTVAASGTVTLQGGIVLKWGTSSYSGTSGSLSIVFPTAFPNNCYFAIANAFTSTNIAANVTTVSVQSTTGITVNRAAGAGVVGNMTVYYCAIGN